MELPSSTKVISPAGITSISPMPIQKLQKGPPSNEANLTSNSTDESVKMPSDAKLKNIDEKMILPIQMRHNFEEEEKRAPPKLSREVFMKKEEIEEINNGQEQKTLKTTTLKSTMTQQTTAQGFSIDNLLTSEQQNRRRRSIAQFDSENGERATKMLKIDDEQKIEELANSEHNFGPQNSAIQTTNSRQIDEKWNLFPTSPNVECQETNLLSQNQGNQPGSVNLADWQNLNALFMGQTAAMENLFALARARETLATEQQQQQQANKQQGGTVCAPQESKESPSLLSPTAQLLNLPAFLLDPNLVASSQAGNNAPSFGPTSTGGNVSAAGHLFGLLLEQQQRGAAQGFQFPPFLAMESAHGSSPSSRRNSLNDESSPVAEDESEEGDGREPSDDETGIGGIGEDGIATSGIGGNGRKKKTRTVFSRIQVSTLEAMFDQHKYLSSQQRTEMAVRLNLTETQVKIWFQNRRNKWKRMGINGEGGMDQPIPNMLDSTNTHHQLPMGNVFGQQQNINQQQLTHQQFQQHRQLALALAGLGQQQQQQLQRTSLDQQCAAALPIGFGRNGHCSPQNHPNTAHFASLILQAQPSNLLHEHESSTCPVKIIPSSCCNSSSSASYLSGSSIASSTISSLTSSAQNHPTFSSNSPAAALTATSAMTLQQHAQKLLLSILPNFPLPSAPPPPQIPLTEQQQQHYSPIPATTTTFSAASSQPSVSAQFNI